MMLGKRWQNQFWKKREQNNRKKKLQKTTQNKNNVIIKVSKIKVNAGEMNAILYIHTHTP